MSRKWIEEYLSFSRKERNAVLLLVVLIIIIFLVPYLFPGSKQPPDARMILLDSTAKNTGGQRNDKMHNAGNAYHRYNNNGVDPTAKYSQPFHFDPNTLSRAGWLKLGLKERTIATIEKYISKGGRFREAADLRKVYGLPPSLTERLIPYVVIKEQVERVHKPPTNYFKSYERNADVKSIVDINKADSISFVSLHGIGPTIAGRILKFREKLGGFIEVKQLGEVYGLADSSFQKIIPRLSVSAAMVKKININEADLAILRQHPYLGRNLAQVIYQYRQQHGKFTSLDDLSGIEILTPDILKKILPYLTTE